MDKVIENSTNKKKDIAALRRFLAAAETCGDESVALDQIIRVFKECVSLEHPSLKRESSIPDRVTHIAILFSSPLVYETTKRELKALDSIPHELEKRNLFSAMTESGRQVTYYEENASVESFRAILDRGCRVLHFVGHGVLGDETDGDALLVEGDCGRALEIDIKTLSKLLMRTDSSVSLRLVFVSSCHSQEVGQVFLRAGADHVIAVRRETSVLSDAACLFAKAFYRSYLCDNRVQDAFEHAKLQVSATSSFDPTQFILMSSSPKEQQQDKAFLGIPPGKFVDLSRNPKFRDSLPSKPALCLGRNKDMHAILDLLSTSRLVTIRGPPGIGKTTVSKELLHYMAPRHLYKDGLIFVPLCDVQTIEGVVLSISHALRLPTPLPTPDRSREPSRADSPMSITSTSTTGSLNSADHLSIRPEAMIAQIFRRVQDILEALKHLEVLIYLDNAESPLTACPKNVRELLTRLLDENPKLHILVSSRNSIGGGIPGTPERVYTLKRLCATTSAELLCRSAPRRLRLEEIQPQKNMDALTSLSQRRIIKILEGHPQAIVIASALLQDKSLDELEELFQNGNFNSSLQINDIPESQRSSTDTLRTSLQMSLDLIQRDENKVESENAVEMFCLLGLLSGGAYVLIPFNLKIRTHTHDLNFPQSHNHRYASDLDFVWKSHCKNVHWKHSIERLVRTSLVERIRRGKMEFFKTFRFFSDFAERDVLSKLPPHKSYRLENLVADRMRAIVKKMFDIYGIASNISDLETLESLLPSYELNVWACLKRTESRMTTNGSVSPKLKSSRKCSSSSSSSNNNSRTFINAIKKCISEFKKNGDKSMRMFESLVQISILMLGMESSLTTSEFVRRTDLVFRIRRIQWNKLKRWRIVYMLNQLRQKHESRIQSRSFLDVEWFLCMEKMAKDLEEEKTIVEEESKKQQSHDASSLEIASSRLAAYFSSLLLLRERREDALKIAEMGLRIARSIRDVFSEACLRKIIGVILLKLRRSEDARKHLGKALILFRQLRSSHGRAACMFSTLEREARECRSTSLFLSLSPLNNQLHSRLIHPCRFLDTWTCQLTESQVQWRRDVLRKGKRGVS